MPAPGPTTFPSLGTRLPIQPSAHHFCFSIDLRSIANLDVSSPVNCFLRWVFQFLSFSIISWQFSVIVLSLLARYTYPFFGSSAPVMTSPPVQVQRNMEVLLPKSFCAFDFAASPQLLQETLTRLEEKENYFSVLPVLPLLFIPWMVFCWLVKWFCSINGLLC